MRISTNLFTQLSLESMLKQQTDLSRTQLQISTGKALLTPADDPYNSSRALDLDESVKINTQYQANSTLAKNRLGMEEGVLEGVTTSIQRIRELVVQANNDSQTPESRSFIAAEAEKILGQLLDLANATDSNNEYLFSGYQGRTKPFAPDGAGNFLYFGDDGQRLLKVGSSTEVSVGDSGKQVFMAVKNGNGTFQVAENAANTGTGVIDPGAVVGAFLPDTYTVKFIAPTVPPNTIYDPVEYYAVDSTNTIVSAADPAYIGGTEAAFLADVGAGLTTGVSHKSGAQLQDLDALGIQTTIVGEPAVGDEFTIAPSQNQDLFKTVQNFIDTLNSTQTTDAEKGHLHNAMNRVLADLDQSLGRVLETRSKIGARLSVLEDQDGINESFNIQMKATLSEIEDLDYAEAITNLNLRLMALEGAQQAYTRIQGLSLFNFIR